MPTDRTARPAFPRALCAGLLLGVACLLAPTSQAADGKLLLTGGVSTIDGAAGGGISPWALTGSYATVGQWGATAHLSAARSQDYSLLAFGATVAWHDRVELSLARQDLNAGDNLAPLGLTGLHLKQDIVGLKLRVAGDAVLDSDSWMPQLAVGLLHKRSDAGALGPVLYGARGGPLGASANGTELYISATKLFLAPGILVNLTLRGTEANQGGLLGFGGANSPGWRVQPEVSVAWLLHRTLAVGAEYRAKPDNLDQSALGAGALQENDWFDLFVAWAPSKTLSLTLAYVDLGRIAPAVQPRRQTGVYASVQVAF
jgi:hypothetical protein